MATPPQLRPGIGGETEPGILPPLLTQIALPASLGLLYLLRCWLTPYRYRIFLCFLGRLARVETLALALQKLWLRRPRIRDVLLFGQDNFLLVYGLHRSHSLLYNPDTVRAFHTRSTLNCLRRKIYNTAYHSYHISVHSLRINEYGSYHTWT